MLDFSEPANLGLGSRGSIALKVDMGTHEYEQWVLSNERPPTCRQILTERRFGVFCESWWLNAVLADKFSATEIRVEQDGTCILYFYPNGFGYSDTKRVAFVGRLRSTVESWLGRKISDVRLASEAKAAAVLDLTA